MTDADWLGQANHYLTDAGNGHRLHPSTLTSFIAMQDAAGAQGIDCQLVSAYRSFDRQCQIWNRKWRGEMPLYDASGHQLDPKALSDDDKLTAILTWSALPGGSRHHWGTDIDVYDRASVKASNHTLELIDSEYCGDGPCAALSNWLDNNAAHFGFFRPFREFKGGVATERWHLSHKASATPFEDSRNIEALEKAITCADLEGKTAVLNALPQLYTRYVLNEGTA